MGMDCYDLEIYWGAYGENMQNSLHFREIDVEDDPDPDNRADEIITGFKATIEAALLLCVCDEVDLIGYKCKRINNGGGPSVSSPSPNTGGRTGPLSDTGMGPCVIWGYTDLTQWRTGRTFIPGCAQLDLTGNAFNQFLIEALHDWIVLMLAVPTITENTHNYEFIIWRRTDEATSAVHTGGVSGKPGVQRRRLVPHF